MYGYITAIAKSLFTVFGIYLVVFKKKWVYAILVFVISISIFSFDGTKTTILNPFFLIGIALFTRYLKDTNGLPLLSIICLTMIAFATIEVIFIHSSILSEYIIRRLFAVPGFLNTVFWDFFSNNPKTLMTESVGKFFIDPIYPIAPTYIIGVEYFNNPAINANTGIWLGGFAQFGLPGMMIVSCLAGFLLGLIDNLTRINFFGLGCLICAFMGLGWIEQMFHTSMLTGGILYLFLGVFLVKKSRNLQQEFEISLP